MLMRLVAVLVLLAASFSVSAKQSDAFDFLDKDKFVRYGDVFQIAIPATAGVYAWQRNDSEGLNMLGRSLVTQAVVVHGLKTLIDAERPNGKGNNSFPSGHTAAAFTGAAFIHHRYGAKKALPAYLLAAGVGASRVAGDRHYWRDVIVGAAIAYVVTKHHTDRYERRHEPEVMISFGFNF